MLVRFGTRVRVSHNSSLVYLLSRLSQHIQDHYYWKDMSKDVNVFVSSCFHCIASALGETTPRPPGEALHATKPNEVIHFDYLYMGPSTDDAKYVLIVKDNYSSYVCLKQCKKADADNTVSVLIEWFAAFGVAPQWVSDQGSHFKNRVMMDVQKQLGTNHHFTTAHSPWSNGTVEAVCKQTIRAAKAQGIIHLYTFCSPASAAQEPTVVDAEGSSLPVLFCLLLDETAARRLPRTLFADDG
jgi:Integrase core domain/Integrase zinc binding domain